MFQVQKQVGECLAPAQELKATLDELGLNLVPRALHIRLRTIAEAVESSAETVPGVALYLSGFGGVGKSTGLFGLAAQLWKRPGWLVVYIAALSGIVDSTPDTKAGILGSTKKMLLFAASQSGIRPRSDHAHFRQVCFTRLCSRRYGRCCDRVSLEHSRLYASGLPVACITCSGPMECQLPSERRSITGCPH